MSGTYSHRLPSQSRNGASMGKVEKGKCQLCGSIAELTKDHLPPQGLYPKSIRSQIGELNNVLACHICNNGSNVDDELLKVVIGDIVDVPWFELSQQGVNATIEKNQRLERLLKNNSCTEWIENEEGHPHPVKTFTLPSELNPNVIGIIEKTVKAFYFQTFREVLVERFSLDFFSPEIPQFHKGLRKEIAEQSALALEHEVNGGTVRYRFFTVQENRLICMINFFGIGLFYFGLIEKHKEQD